MDPGKIKKGVKAEDGKPKEEQMREPTMKKVRGQGVELQAAIWEGSGRTVVCVHGLTANCRCWDVVAAGLAPAHRVISYDLRGRGLSEKPASGYSEAIHVHDLNALITDLGLQKPVLMGHSLGAYISLGLAAEMPGVVGGLILVDGGGDLPQSQWDKIGTAIRPSLQRLGQRYDSVEACIAAMSALPVFTPWSPALEAYFRYDLEPVAGGFQSRVNLAHIQEEMANKRQTGAAPFYGRLTCPVLILRATDGLLAPDDILLPQSAVDRMLAEIADSRCMSLSGTNHYSILWQPNAQRDKAIADFLAGRGTSPAPL
jgi:pimeloyl-ACP methyl ester carboxylesterase